MRSHALIALLVLNGCWDISDGAPPPTRSLVLSLPAIANNDVDLLFVIDDSMGMLDKQTNLKAGFPSFVNQLSSLSTGFPNLHLGVVTSDLGTSADADVTPGSSIGTGPGSCASTGKRGALQTNGTSLVTGSFISDVGNTDGTRSTNYTGTLVDAFDAIASVGGAGCGFEQTIEAAKRAFNNNPANTGFLRPSANLAVVFVSDEDDCSAEHTSLFGTDTALGPLQSFRCTRFGVTCDVNGATTSAMNNPGAKDQCHANDQSMYLSSISSYVDFFKGLKSDPRTVMVGALIGDPAPVAVALVAPPGGGTPLPALQPSCGTNTSVQADPAVRIDELARGFDHHAVETLCSEDLSPGLVAIGQQLGTLLGNPCLTEAIAEPADCVVADEPAGGAAIAIPRCPSSGDCYTIATDATGCPAAPQLKLTVTRASMPAPTVATTVRCMLPQP